MGALVIENLWLILKTRWHDPFLKEKDEYELALEKLPKPGKTYY